MAVQDGPSDEFLNALLGGAVARFVYLLDDVVDLMTSSLPV